MKTISIVNRKGGVGKTRTALEVSYILATSCGQRVLLVDADGQGNTTSILLGNYHGDGLAPLMTGLATCYYSEVIFPTGVAGLDILPASEALDDMDLEFMLSAGRPTFHALQDLRDNITEDDTYDVIVIDCPPHYSATCINAIAASDAIIIPTTTDAFSATGMDGLVKQIENVRRICPSVRVSGCLVTRYCGDVVDQDALDILREDAPVPVFKTVIRESTVKVKGSSWAGMTAQEWSPWCNTSRDYRQFVAELIAKEGLCRG